MSELFEARVIINRVRETDSVEVVADSIQDLVNLAESRGVSVHDYIMDAYRASNDALIK